MRFTAILLEVASRSILAVTTSILPCRAVKTRGQKCCFGYTDVPGSARHQKYMGGGGKARL